MVKYADEILVSDPGWYVYYAEECVKHGTMYPDYSNYHDEYIFAPGWVNFIILGIKLLGGVNWLPLVNVAFDSGIILILYLTGRSIFENKNVGYLACYLYMLLPTFFTMSNHLFTEPPFVFLILLSFYLVWKCKNVYTILIAGGIIAVANWIRPLALAWMIPAVLLLVFYNKKISYAFSYIFGIISVSVMIAFVTHINFPDYIYKSTTGGVNLIMIADSENIEGGFSETSREKGGLGYLEGATDSSRVTNILKYATEDVYFYRQTNKYTYYQYDSIYKCRAMNWIINNPELYVAQIPYKIKNLFKPYYLTYSTKPKHIKSSYFAFPQIYVKYLVLIRNIYYIYMLFFIGWVCHTWRKKETQYIVLPVILSMTATVIIVTMSRYSIIILPFIYLGVSDFLRNIYYKVRDMNTLSSGDRY